MLFNFGRDPVTSLHEEDAIFYYKSFRDLKMVFAANGDGTYNFFLYQPAIAPRKALRVIESEVEASYYETLIGRYKSEELRVEFELRYKEDRIFEVFQEGELVGGAGLVLKDELLTDNYRISVLYDVFDRVSALLISTDRSKDVRFVRNELGDFNRTLDTDEGGKISVGNTSSSYVKGNGDILLTKSDLEGNELWFKTYGGKGYDISSELIATKDGGSLIIGSTSSFGNGNYDMYVIKVNEEGKELWSSTYGYFYNDYGYQADETENGFILKGTRQECSSNSDVFDRTCTTVKWAGKD